MLKAQNIFFIFFLLFWGNLNAQIDLTRNWYFGDKAALRFEDTGIVILNNSKLITWEGCSSISDEFGNLVLYSDGKKIWNKYHRILKNGEGLLGDISSTQSVLIINHSDNDSIYYVFTTPYAFNYNVGLNYSIVNIKSNKDSGEVILKNIILHSNSSEKINAVNHLNGKDIWIVGHEFGNNNFYTYLLKNDGIVKCPIISSQGFVFSGNQFINQGNLKFSSDGRMLVNTQLFNMSNEYIELFFFNNLSGQLNFNKRIPNLAGVYGAEFSSNNKFLYITETNKIQQINLEDYSIYNVASYSSFRKFNSMQIGKDRKIYISQNDSFYLGIINYPNLFGNNCNFLPNGLFIDKKSKFGLPNFNQSYFYNPSINYTYEMNCIKNSIQFWGKDTFGANSHSWQVRKNFGVNNYQLIGSSKDINYTFADSGTYEVRYIASNGNKIDSVVKSIVIYDKIKQDFLGKDTAYVQGDVINKTLIAPTPNHCVRWYDLTPSPSPKERGTGSSLLIDSVGTYICKVTNQAFCEVWDTVVISECINNLNQPSLYRSRDTLRTFHLNADSFVWYRNNQIYKVTKQPFLALTDTGNYRVEAAKKGHCNRGSVGQLLVNKLSVKGIRIEDLGIRVFPNPSSGIISIQSQNPFKLKVNTILGQTIYEGENINNIHLQKGVYFLHFEVEGNRYVEKVVVW